MNKATKNYALIDTIMECVQIVEEVLLNQDVLALDCEGIFLSKEGRLTLLQVKLYQSSRLHSKMKGFTYSIYLKEAHLCFWVWTMSKNGD